MENPTINFERIDRELQELRNRFAKAGIVLGDLEEIQSEFEDLAETYKQLKNYVSEVSRFNAESNEIIKLIQQAQTNFEQRFAKLKETNEFKAENLNGKFEEIQDELNTCHSQIDELHQNFAEKMSLFQDCQPGVRDIKNTINDLRSEISKIQTDVDGEFSQFKKDVDQFKKDVDQFKKDVDQFKKDVDKKISEVQEDIVSLVKTDSRNQKKMRRMWNAIIALFILWLCLVALVLVK